MRKKTRKEARKTKKDRRCTAPQTVSSCCSVVSLVQVDQRGQMVLPKELRDKAGIRAGDKLAVVAVEKDGKVCCLTLMKAEELSDMVLVKIAPAIKEAGK